LAGDVVEMSDNGLNIFQRLTRRWESVHPYNAAQVMRIGGHVDGDSATAAWGEALRALGLGRVRIYDEARFRHEVLNGELARYPVRVLPLNSSLESHLSAELNRAFDDPEEPPFRPFLLHREDDFYLGVVYQHWVADSVSIRAVLRQWFTLLFDPPAARASALSQPREGYWGLFASRSDWRLAPTLLANFCSHIRHRRARKVLTAGARDYPVRVTLAEAPLGLIDQLRESARDERVKLHDILLASMAETCDRFVPVQARPNRPDLSVGSIVDLRRHTSANLSDTFGLFLGFTHVICRRADLQQWPRLLRSVATQNHVHKQTGLAQASLVWMVAALIAGRFLPDWKVYHFYRKELPMLGGLSNVTLNDTWAARYYPEPLREYLRVSPTGPLVPLVFSTTTLGPRLSIAVTFRENLMSPDIATEMTNGFLNRLICATGQGRPDADR
jgi:hypothetical protein